MPVDKANFRRVLGHFASGVTVVTTKDPDGKPYGLTATAFSSVSLEPPLILVCIDKKAESYPHFWRSNVFAVNFLKLEDRDTSQHFAKSGGDKFTDRSYHTAATGAPLLENTLGFLDCTVAHSYDGGDHTIFVGLVEAADAVPGAPLMHFLGTYRALTEPL